LANESISGIKGITTQDNERTIHPCTGHFHIGGGGDGDENSDNPDSEKDSTNKRLENVGVAVGARGLTSKVYKKWKDD
jgi:hypothetical protein